jgi:hypothetical protein
LDVQRRLLEAGGYFDEMTPGVDHILEMFQGQRAALTTYAASLYRGLSLPGGPDYSEDTINRAVLSAGTELQRDRREKYQFGVSPAQAIEVLQRKFIEELAAESKPFAGELQAGQSVTNVTFTGGIRIDLKSDASPEGIAVNFQKAMDTAVRFPTRGTRMVPVGPGPASAR